MFSAVPWVVSPTARLGRNFHQQRTLHSRFSIGWFSITPAGVTGAGTHQKSAAARRELFT
jgi:hypothetical protein